MLMTISYYNKPATDLGYLLHKNPTRPQAFNLSYGKAYVFYPKVSEEECTIALLLDIDPISLTRHKNATNEGGIFEYINDRPYVSSSFLSVALPQIFGTAMSGKSKDRPELVDKPFFFKVKIVMLPCHGHEDLIVRLFGPLGYQVKFEGYNLDENYPEWGKSRYYTISIEGEVKIRDLLNHLYILIPVLDMEKHYWINEEEIDKLLRHGEGWLNNHPEKEIITSRYLRKQRSLVNIALDKLNEDENINLEELPPINNNKVNHLNEQRLNMVVETLKKVNAKKVIDIGCGEGKLLSLLLKDNFFTQITGVDVSYNALEIAKERLNLDRIPENIKNKINLFQGSLTYRDQRFNGYDAITIIEVIEHLELNRLPSLEKVIFKYARPKTVIISTPNKDYNINYQNIKNDELRHHDHRFELSREEFKNWSKKIEKEYGYSVTFVDIGESSREYGSPTQMGVFTL